MSANSVDKNIFSLPGEVLGRVTLELTLSEVGSLSRVCKILTPQFVLEHYCYANLEKGKRDLAPHLGNRVVQSLGPIFIKFLGEIAKMRETKEWDFKAFIKQAKWIQNFLLNVKCGTCSSNYSRLPGLAQPFEGYAVDSLNGLAFFAGGEHLFQFDIKTRKWTPALPSLIPGSALALFENFLYIGTKTGQIQVVNTKNFDEQVRVKAITTRSIMIGSLSHDLLFPEDKILGISDPSTKIEQMSLINDKLAVLKTVRNGNYDQWNLDLYPSNLTKAEGPQNSLDLKFKSISSQTKARIMPYPQNNSLEISFVTQIDTDNEALVERLERSMTVEVLNLTASQLKTISKNYVDRYVEERATSFVSIVAMGIECQGDAFDNFTLFDFTAQPEKIWVAIADREGMGFPSKFDKRPLAEKDQIFGELYKHHSLQPGFHTNDVQYGEHAWTHPNTPEVDKAIAILNYVYGMLNEEQRNATHFELWNAAVLSGQPTHGDDYGRHAWPTADYYDKYNALQAVILKAT